MPAEKAILAAYRQLARTDVLVGFPAGGPQAEGSAITLAALAYIQNNGAPEANIPARPFMEPGIQAAQDRIVAQLRKAGQAVARGDAEGVRAGQEAAGMVAVAAIKTLITDGIAPPLAPATLAARKREGFQGETPLLRTGQLRNGVQYVVVRR